MWSFIVQTWDTIVFEPVFNLMAFLLSVVPWHNFGIALIIFTILLRLLLYPMIKKQLQAVKKQKELQPKVAEIRKANKGNRQQEALEIMALYKEQGFNPFATIVYLLIQLPVFIGLYQVINQIARNPQSLANDTYGFIQSLGWVQDLAADPGVFDPTFIGLVDLTRAALSNGEFYLGAFAVVVATTLMQFLTSKQMAGVNGGAPQRSLRQIMKEQSEGGEVDKAEMNAAMSRLFVYVLPAIIFIFAIGWYAALPFWWLISGIMQFFQQKRINSQDGQSVKAVVDGQNIVGAEINNKSLNAKQKRMQAKNLKQTTAGRRLKRIQATSRTVKKKKV